MATPSIFVNVLCTPQVNWQWDNLVFVAAQAYGGVQRSTGAQDAEASFDFYAEAGTYTLDVFHGTGTDRGIYTVEVDGVQVGTIDGYLGAGGAATRSSVIGITIATTGVHRIRLRMATKHASSSSYFGYLSGLYLTRTGA